MSVIKTKCHNRMRKINKVGGKQLRSLVLVELKNILIIIFNLTEI